MSAGMPERNSGGTWAGAGDIPSSMAPSGAKTLSVPLTAAKSVGRRNSRLPSRLSHVGKQLKRTNSAKVRQADSAPTALRSPKLWRRAPP
jgi:hypothetical protein